MSLRVAGLLMCRGRAQAEEARSKTESWRWKRGPEVSSRGAQNTNCRFEISKREVPKAVGRNRAIMLFYEVCPMTRAFPVGPHLWP